jgi:hypothetical protein
MSTARLGRGGWGWGGGAREPAPRLADEILGGTPREFLGGVLEVGGLGDLSLTSGTRGDAFLMFCQYM